MPPHGQLPVGAAGVSGRARVIKKHIRSLQSSIDHLDLDIQAQVMERDALIDEIKTARSELATCDVIVSDHAICRYLERYMGVDLDLVRERLVPKTMAQCVPVLGGEGRYPMEGGGTAVLRNKHVVTCL